MADVIVFGTGDYAEQAEYYLKTDSPHRVVAFALTGDYIREAQFLGRPVVPFETVEQEFPTSDFEFFLPMSSRRMNRDRQTFFDAAKAKGYRLISYVSSGCFNHAASIGENCFILEGCTLQPFSRIRNNTVIWCSTHVGHHTLVEDHVFLSGNVTISGRCEIGENCHVSGGSIVDANLRLAPGTLVGLASAVTRNTEPWSVYLGNPARKRRMSSLDVRFL